MTTAMTEPIRQIFFGTLHGPVSHVPGLGDEHSTRKGWFATKIIDYRDLVSGLKYEVHYEPIEIQG